MTKKFLLSLCATVIAVATLQVRLQSQNSFSVAREVRFAAVGMENSREQLRCFRAIVTAYSKTPKQYFDSQRSLALRDGSHLTPDERAQILKQLPTSDQETTLSSHFYYKNSSLFIRTQTDPKIAVALRSQSIVIDANRSFALQEYDEKKGQSPQPNDRIGLYSFGFITPRRDVLKDDIAQGFELSDPRSFAYFDYPGGEPLNQRLTRVDFKPTYLGEEKVENSRCMKIEVSFDQSAKILYWIDIEHSFILRRREERIYVGKELLLTDEMIVPSVQESNGFWLPTVVETRNFLTPIKSTPGQSPQVDPSGFVFTRTTISEFKADCDIPADTFVMKWPKGTNVRNQITQTGFVAGADDVDQKPQSTGQKPGEQEAAQTK